MPHARAEEEVLYPEWATLVGFADAAAPMIHDHEAIVARIERLGQADPGDADGLQELLYGLHALIGTHFRKEEDLQLPAFDAAPPEVTARVLERMAGTRSREVRPPGRAQRSMPRAAPGSPTSSTTSTC